MSILGYMHTFPWGNFFNKNNEVSSSESLDDDNTQYTSLEEDNEGIISSIVQIIFSFWSFEVSEGTLSNQKIIIGLESFSNQRLNI